MRSRSWSTSSSICSTATSRPICRVYTVDPKTGRPEPYLTGKDPMEIVHDRERERYSKHISRTFTRGTYYLEVNANHPDYILRTRVLRRAPL